MLEQGLIAAPAGTYLVTVTDELYTMMHAVIAYRIDGNTKEIITNDHISGDCTTAELGMFEGFAHGLVDSSGRVLCGRALFTSVEEFRSWCEARFERQENWGESEAQLRNEADAMLAHADALEKYRHQKFGS